MLFQDHQWRWWRNISCSDKSHWAYRANQSFHPSEKIISKTCLEAWQRLKHSSYCIDKLLAPGWVQCVCAPVRSPVYLYMCVWVCVSVRERDCLRSRRSPQTQLSVCPCRIMLPGRSLKLDQRVANLIMCVVQLDIIEAQAGNNLKLLLFSQGRI